MKNTMQRYYILRIYANISVKNMFYNIKFPLFENCCLQMSSKFYQKATKRHPKSIFCSKVKASPSDRQIGITKYTFQGKKVDFFCQRLANIKELL